MAKLVPKSCFHCGEIIPNGIKLSVIINTKTQAMCCIGCQAVAQTIVENNFSDYYRFRTENAPKSDTLVPEQLLKTQLLDDDNLQNEFIYKDGDTKESILTIEGISCAACAWLIEMQLTKLEGLTFISVNATTQRATVRWSDKKLKLSQILIAIENIGYHALPFKASDIEASNLKQSKTFIKRLGVSGILMMQVMMIAIGLYFGTFSDMSEHNHVYLRWVSLLLTLPIVTYGALPFYLGAINTLKAKRLSMDVPVSIAISLAFSASAWATIEQIGEVYFESVSMFTFLLLIGKFLEFRARNRAAEVSANLLRLMPLTATKIVGNKEEFIAARKLCALDIVLIKPGEIIPADGQITFGSSQVNEAMLTGEQSPVDKAVGEQVFAGTVNGDGNLTVEVKQAGQNSFLHQLIRLSEASQAHKPKLAQLSDKIAQYFVAVILLTAIGTAIYWQQHMPSEAFWITLSVLVATCPCALSLATPTALTCSTIRLNKDGIIIKSSHGVETIPSINCIALDKTGTLTSGDFEIEKVIEIEKQYSQAQILAFAAALESHSEHPIARAFVQSRDYNFVANSIKVISGCGIQGNVNELAVKIGKPEWFLSSKVITTVQFEHHQHAQCLLTIDEKLVAAIYLKDNIRPDAASLINYLHSQKIQTAMLSGDNAVGCEKIQSQLHLGEVFSQLTANQKLEKIKELLR